MTCVSKIKEIADQLSELDEGDMVELMEELAWHNPELVVDVKLAAQRLIDEWKEDAGRVIA